MTAMSLNFAPLSQMPLFAADCQRYCALTWFGQNAFRAALTPFTDLWLEPELSDANFEREAIWGESWYGEA